MTCNLTFSTNMEWRALGASAAEGCEHNLVAPHAALLNKQEMAYRSEKPDDHP